MRHTDVADMFIDKMQMEDCVLNDAVIKVETSGSHENARNDERSTGVSPISTTAPHAQQAPEQ